MEDPGGAIVHGVTKSHTRLTLCLSLTFILKFILDEKKKWKQINRLKICQILETYSMCYEENNQYVNVRVFKRVRVKVKLLSCIWLFATPWTEAYQVSLSMEFSRQEYWSGLSFPSPGDSSQPRDWTQVSYIAGRHFTIWATREACLDGYFT